MTFTLLVLESLHTLILCTSIRVWFASLKAHSDELCLTHAALAEVCGAEKLKNSYLCGNTTVCPTNAMRGSNTWKTLRRKPPVGLKEGQWALVVSPYQPLGWGAFFKKMGQSRPLFCLFLFFSHYNFNNTNCKKCRWCAWDLNPGPQDGRHRQNHGAMAAFRGLFNL